MELDKTGVSLVLSALGDHLEQLASEEIEIVVCGGSALQALGLVDRTTRDVDILAFARSERAGSPTLLSARPIPGVVRDAARIVARDFRLPADWLNPGPTDLLNQGLPQGLAGRLHTHRFGKSLIIHFIDRLDQICLKTYAAINGGGPRHLTDLRALDPSEDEMLMAARWCLTQDASEVFPHLVHSFLEKVGYPDVAGQLKKDS